ncbi:MAG: hypothetical protein ABJD07_03125 [Gemmatimonadaceae bacterium]
MPNEPIAFEVEQAVLIARDLPIVLARCLTPESEFSVLASTTLGGCCVAQFLGIPRALRADGTPRLNLFAFALCAESDLEQFTPGAHVLLENEA